MTFLAILFCLIFLAQVLLISIYYPWQFRRQIGSILEHHPPHEYPRLYPNASVDIAKVAPNALRLYWGLNLVVAAVGLSLIGLAAGLGYTPNPRGGMEVVVIAFAFLQMIPHLLAELSAAQLYRLMRRANRNTIRTAALEPRRIADFVSPVAVLGALLLFPLWMIVYLYRVGNDPWEARVIVTLLVVTGLHIMCVGGASQAMHGRKQDPHMSAEDRFTRIASVVRISVFTSIGVSLFLIATDSVRAFGLDVFEPAMTSVYVQLLAVLGATLAFRSNKISQMDFSVYRGETQ